MMILFVYSIITFWYSHTKIELLIEQFNRDIKKNYGEIHDLYDNSGNIGAKDGNKELRRNSQARSE